MKQKKLNQILKLYLLSSRAYENINVKSINSNSLTDLNLIQIISDLKKAFYTIFKYHQAHKKILFVGLPNKLASKINTFTHHAAANLNLELQEIIANNFKNVLFSKVSSELLLLKLSKKPDLVVLFSDEKKQDSIIKGSIAKIPVIKFISSNLKKNINKNFDTIENFSQNLVLTSDKSLFFFGLNFLFKRLNKKNPFENNGT